MKDKFLNISKRFIKSEFISGAVYVFLGLMLSSFLSFLVNFYFARNLNRADYGVYASLLALITLFIIPAGSLSPIIVKFAGNYFAKGENEKLRKFYQKTTKLSVGLFILILLCFLLISPILKDFLKLDNIWYIPLVGLVTAMSYINIVNNGFLQGLLKFPQFSLNQFFGALVRFVLGVIFVFFGFRIFGAIWPSFFLFLTVYVLGLFQLRSLFLKVNKVNIKIQGGELIKYAAPTAIALLSLSSFISIDVILVKHFFNANDAGLYSGLSLIGKVIFYFTGMIPSVMFPLVVKRHAKGEKIANLFYMSIFLVTIPSIIITGFYYLLPSFSIKLFLGSNYLDIVPYLGFFAVYITIFSILNVCVNFFLSIGKTKVFIPVLIGTIAQIIFIYIFHNSFYQIIGVSLIICLLLLFYLLSAFARQYINFKEIRNHLAPPNSAGI